MQISVSSYGSFAPEVEPDADIADDLGVRISLSHEGDLSGEVSRLLLGRDAAVADGLRGSGDTNVGVAVISALAAFGQNALERPSRADFLSVCGCTPSMRLAPLAKHML